MPTYKLRSHLPSRFCGPSLSPSGHNIERAVPVQWYGPPQHNAMSISSAPLCSIQPWRTSLQPAQHQVLDGVEADGSQTDGSLMAAYTSS